jgi:chromosomal replication initiation ATPase DnaA
MTEIKQIIEQAEKEISTIRGHAVRLYERAHADDPGVKEFITLLETKFELAPGTLKAKIRTRNIADIRKLFWYTLRKNDPIKYKLEYIASVLNRNHRSVLSGISQARNFLISDSEFREKAKFVQQLYDEL